MSLINQTVSVPKRKRTVVPAKFREEMSQRLLIIRNSLEFSQAEMAKGLSVERDAYAKWEARGKTSSAIPQHVIAEICRLSGHDLWWFMTGEAPSKAPKPLA